MGFELLARNHRGKGSKGAIDEGFWVNLRVQQFIFFVRKSFFYPTPPQFLFFFRPLVYDEAVIDWVMEGGVVRRWVVPQNAAEEYSLRTRPASRRVKKLPADNCSDSWANAIKSFAFISDQPAPTAAFHLTHHKLSLLLSVW